MVVPGMERQRRCVNARRSREKAIMRRWHVFRKETMNETENHFYPWYVSESSELGALVTLLRGLGVPM